MCSVEGRVWAGHTRVLARWLTRACVVLGTACRREEPAWTMHTRAASSPKRVRAPPPPHAKHASPQPARRHHRLLTYGVSRGVDVWRDV